MKELVPHYLQESGKVCFQTCLLLLTFHHSLCSSCVWCMNCYFMFDLRVYFIVQLLISSLFLGVQVFDWWFIAAVQGLCTSSLFKIEIFSLWIFQVILPFCGKVPQLFTKTIFWVWWEKPCIQGVHTKKSKEPYRNMIFWIEHPIIVTDWKVCIIEIWKKAMRFC